MESHFIIMMLWVLYQVADGAMESSLNRGTFSCIAVYGFFGVMPSVFYILRKEYSRVAEQLEFDRFISVHLSRRWRFWRSFKAYFLVVSVSLYFVFVCTVLLYSLLFAGPWFSLLYQLEQGSLQGVPLHYVEHPSPIVSRLQGFDNLKMFHMDSDAEREILLVEDCATLAFRLMRARDKRDLAVTLYEFWRKRENRSALSTLAGRKLPHKEAFDFVSSLFPVQGEQKLQGWEESFASIRGAYSDLRGVAASENFQKLKKIFLFATSRGVFQPFGLDFDTMGYSKLEQAYVLKKMPKGTVSTIDFVVDSLLFVSETGFQISKGASPWEIFHSSSNYQALLVRLKHVEHQASLVATGCLEGYEGDANLSSALNVLLTDTGDVYTRAKCLGGKDELVAQEYFHRAQKLHSQVHRQILARKVRRMPFMCLINGGSGIGKSQITEIIFAHFAGWFGLDPDSSKKYKVDPTAKYWNGFRTEQWCVVLDDIGFRHPKSMTGGDPTVDVIIPLANTTPFMPDQAQLELKDSTPARPDLVIGTTNIKDMNVRSYYSFPRAALRRFPFIITPTVKSEHADVDGELKPVLGTPCTDFWDFTVETLSFQKHGSVPEYVVEARFSCVGDLMRWLKDRATKHRDRQASTFDATTELYSSGMCETCNLLGNFCTCIVPHGDQHLQGAETIIAFSFLSFMMGFFIAFFQSVREFIKYWIFISWVRSTRSRLYDFIHEKYLSFRGRTVDAEQRFIALGDKIRVRVFTTPHFLLFFTGILVSTALVRYFLSAPDLQGSQGSRPQPFEGGERQNVWRQDDFQEASFVKGPTVLQTMSFDDACRVVRGNTVQFDVETAMREMSFKGVAIKENHFLINNHVLPEGDASIKVLFGPVGQVSENITIPKRSCVVRRYPDRDLAVLSIPNIRHFRDISHLFSDDINGAMPGKVIHRDGFATQMHEFYGRTYSVNQKELGITMNTIHARTQWKSVDGDCGSPYILKCGTSVCFGGIHVMAVSGGPFSSTPVANVVTKSDISKLFLQPSVDVGEPDFGEGKFTHVLQGLHYKSPFRFFADGVASVYGSVNNRSSPKSTVGNTALRDAYLGLGGLDPKYRAPVMSGWRPWRLALEKILKPVSGFSSADLEWARTDYINQIRSANLDLSTLEVYDQEVAVNGMPGIAYVDSMKRSTSAGWPFKKKKEHFLEPDISDTWPQGVKPNEDVQTRIDRIEELYSSGIRFHPVFVASLKDEPVSQAKFEKGKTRVFCAAPFDWCVVVRRFFLSHTRLIQNNKFTFECAVGTAAQGYEWEHLYRYITRFGEDRIVAGDYSGFDKQMPPSVIMAAFEILIDLARDSDNFSDEDLLIMRCIAADTAFPTVDYHGDIVQFWGSNPSGQPLTVIINSIANSLYMRMAYRNMIGESQFNKDVSLLTYGDDNIMSVRRGVDFGHTKIAAYFASVGIGYTMADKEAESVPFLHIKDASFLKRSWVFDDEFDAHLAPLLEESIHKMLCVTTISKSVPHLEQCADIIRAALCEYAQYGREVYNMKRELMVELISQVENLDLYFDDQPLLRWEHQVLSYVHTSSSNHCPHPFLGCEEMSN